ncbi:glycosyl transferase family 2 [Flavobacterium sp. 316]|uniref:Glycosyltransferase family 2 protein n=1 Tax=Flavobacterium sediminilitoris TaxID=2024526 RepID=A0ABY4HM71_9FLAO|nr:MULTISPECIES: glycosyltransferase family 2 protein [Flavobacterium]KIX22396.1 glycosyl transferase family 2 [Flavobacterium sp. 316]UOX33665.1 glycosyltransferase family 2 protein [Flavobacterium sediminilitoris]
MKLSVIITTYNSEEWLKKVLIGYENQTENDFEVVIADDGSTQKTRELLDQFSHSFKYPIIHVWQEDNGFQKCKILNKAILKANSDYIIFTDGDCIPREDFVSTHLKYKRKGYFLSGGYFKLPLYTSSIITKEDILSKQCFNPSWLSKNKVKTNFKLTKLIRFKPFTLFMNWITPTKRTFNGHNTSCFKEDLIAVNGFNEDMQYGGLDREIGERMLNYGILSKQIRYSAICLHLDHERGYFKQEEWDKNLKIRAYNIKNKIIQTKNGILKL